MSTDLVRAPIAIPPALARAGVTVIEQDGVRAVQIPAAMHETHNVVQPVTEIAQADPDWTPRLVEVYISPDLDPPKPGQAASYGGRHVYVQDKMLALNKNAILLLAHAAGIEVSVQPMPRALLREQEIGYHAVAALRRSDGTVARWEASRTVDVDVERERVKASCMKNGQLNKDYFVKRWGTELDHLRAKVESKAMLRAVVAALQLKRGGYTEEELRKPFLIVGYSLTPSDPAVRAERARMAGSDAYGRRALDAGPSVAVAPDPEPEAAAAPAPVEPEEHVDPSDVEVEHGNDPGPAEPSADEIPGEPDAVEPDQAPVAGEIPPAVVKAGEYVIPFGKHKGRTIAQVAADPKFPTQIEWLATKYAPGQAVADAHAPLIAAASTWHDWAQTQEASA